MEIIRQMRNHFLFSSHSITSCETLSKEDYFDVIVDFSSYQPGVMVELLELMREKFGLYVYISSDSVYEVCQDLQRGEPSQETHSIRPVDSAESERLNKADSYGHNKLACEEVLENLYKLHSFNYISLRLPDVIGPRDNTDRFWYYFIWTLTHNEIGFPLMIPTWLASHRLSFVYSLDVAALITETLLKPIDEYLNQAFNLACSETLTLQEFLIIIGNSLNISVSFIEGGSEYYFPSVTRGPVNCTKALKILNWKATPIQVAIDESIAFYRNSLNSPQFAFLVKKIIADLEGSLLPKEKINLFRAELSKHTEHAPSPKEEL